MTRLPLSMAMGDYDRTRPIHDGRVQIDGVDPITQLLSPEEMFFRAFRHDAFDVSEISFSSYCVKLARGEASYVALPVFLSRAFRHTSVYIRTDRGIAGPQDLRGRRIGLAEYQLSANVWVRALLQDDFGVAPSDITWVRGGMDSPGRPEKIALRLPADVRLEQAPEGATLNAMLAAGEIDGFIGPRWRNWRGCQRNSRRYALCPRSCLPARWRPTPSAPPPSRPKHKASRPSAPRSATGRERWSIGGSGTAKPCISTQAPRPKPKVGRCAR